MKVTILNTGGTFNKRYNPLNGELEVPKDNIALNEIVKSCHNVDFTIENIISKDSLDMNDDDREIIVKSINSSQNKNFIIIHGTDTIDLTSKYLSEKIIDKVVILTGAMVPMSIEKVEATMNFSLALGAISCKLENGIYIAMHGVVMSFEKLKKDKTLGKFLTKL